MSERIDLPRSASRISPQRRKGQAVRSKSPVLPVARHGEFLLGLLSLDPAARSRQSQVLVRATQRLIASGLSERLTYYDPVRNPDLEHFAAHYADAVVVVARRQRAVVGCGVLIPEGAMRGRVVRMSVRSDVRRLGVGGAVLAQLIGHARRLGYCELVLETTSTWTDAVAFYQRHAFEVTERRDGDTHFRLNLEGTTSVEPGPN